MKKISTQLIVFVICMAPLLLHAQSFVYLGDTVYLKIQGVQYADGGQWEQSSDNVSWSDISGATYDNYPIVPTQSKFYRARVNSGTCNPFYSEVIKIDVVVFQCGDTLIDYRDGKKYPTVQIGSQCWMAKNLDVGTQITHSNTVPPQANNGILEKYCYNNSADSCIKYGGLYTWDEMMAYTEIESGRGICPCGWHVPSDPEWIVLEVALGMDLATANLYNTWRGTDQGTQLKAGGSSGYNALLCGDAIPGGTFWLNHEYEYMHSSTPYGTMAWRRCLRINDATVGRWNTFPKSYGLSVRCVKNQ
jgi:uncharacterized protein (TIGR02145 family)